MLSYKIPEAIELLATKLKNAEVSLQSLQDDLKFLREQITVMEVKTARQYNGGVWSGWEKGERKMLSRRPGNSSRFFRFNPPGIQRHSSGRLYPPKCKGRGRRGS